MPGYAGFTLGRAVVEVAGDASGAIKAIDDTQTHLGASIFIFRTAGYALQSIGQAALSGFSQASQAAGDFNSSLVKTSNLTSIADFDINKVHDSLLRMAQETGKTPMELADGFYYAASVLNNLNDALAVTEVAAKGSAVGLGNVSDITRVLTSVMNVYGFTAKDTNHLMDVLITMVKDGAGEADQFAGAIGRIIPIAKVAGVTFEDVAAALATATRAGLSVDEATTAVNRTLTELIGASVNTNKMLATLGFSTKQIDDAMNLLANSTATVTTRLEAYGIKGANADKIIQELTTNHDLAEKNMAKFGLTAAQVANVEQTQQQALDGLRKSLIPYGLSLNDIDTVLRAYNKDTEEGRLALSKYGISSSELRDVLKGPNGLYNALTLIMERTQGNDAELRKIFPNIRGFIGILATAGTQGAEYKSILQEMSVAQNVLNADFQKTAATQAFAAQKAQATLDTLKIRIGESLAPTLIAVLNAITPLLTEIGDFAAKHPKAFEIITLGLFGMAGGVYALGSAAQATAGIIAITRSITFLIAAASGVPILVTAFSAIGDAIAISGAFLLGTGGAIILIIAGIILIGYLLITHWKQLSDTVKGLGELLGTFFVLVWDKVRNAIGGFFSSMGSAVHNKMTEIWNTITTGINTAWVGITTAISNAVTRAVNAVINGFKALPGILLGAIMQVANNIGYGIGRTIRYGIDAITAIIDFIQAMPGAVQGFIHAIPGFFQDMWNAIYSFTIEKATALGAWIHATMDGISGFFGDLQTNWPLYFLRAYTAILTFTQNIWGAIWTWIVSAMKQGLINILQGVSDTITLVQSVFSDLFSRFRQGLRDQLQLVLDIFGTIVQFLQDLGPKLWALAENVAGSFWEGFKKGIGKSSPSYIERAFFDISNAAKLAVGDVHEAIRVMNTSVPTVTMTRQLVLAGMGGASSSTAGGAAGGLNIGSMVIQNPQSEVDLIAALQRQQYLARASERGIAPPVVKE